MSLKIISQNVMCWGIENLSSVKIRKPLLSSVFKNHGADIIGMQEVTEEWEKIFDQELKDFGKLLIYRGKNDREAVPIYWKKDRLDVLDKGYFWLSETPEKESLGWDAACLRITCWIMFRERKTNKEFTFVNTHLDHRGEKAQINGLQLIFDFIKNKFGDGIPLILTGDFNAVPGSETIKKADSLLNDSRNIAENTTSGITYHGYRNENQKIIDYIYLSRGIKCKKFEIIKELDAFGRPQSDHYGIMAETEI